ncbi:MAG: hypothetical protein U0X20_17880 [Caldilineaceae bacterium]
MREDKLREFSDGCDGTWVAHPDLVPTVLEIADEYLGDKPNQKERLRETSAPPTSRLPPWACPAARSPKPACGSTSRLRCST